MALFKKPPPPEPPPPKTHISRNTKIEGEILSDEDATVGGTIEGFVNVKGTLAILQSGLVKDRVECGSLSCDGRGEGNLTVTSLARFTPTARWEGEFRLKRMHISQGACVEGLFFKI